jgi:hypothetical protein
LSDNAIPNSACNPDVADKTTTSNGECADNCLDKSDESGVKRVNVAGYHDLEKVCTQDPASADPDTDKNDLCLGSPADKSVNKEKQTCAKNCESGDVLGSHDFNG